MEVLHALLIYRIDRVSCVTSDAAVPETAMELVDGV